MPVQVIQVLGNGLLGDVHPNRQLGGAHRVTFPQDLKSPPS